MIKRFSPSILILAMVIFCCEDDKIEQHKIKYEVRTSPWQGMLKISYTGPFGLEEVDITLDNAGIWSSLEYIFHTGDFIRLTLINCGGKVNCRGFIYMDDNEDEVKDCNGEGDSCPYMVP